MNKDKLDMRILALCKLFSDIQKKIYNEKTKEKIRNNEIDVINTSYADFKRSMQSCKHYFKDGKEIQLDTSAIIKAYCVKNGITEEKEEKQNYKLEIVPSKTAQNMLIDMLNNTKDSNRKDVQKTVQEVKTILGVEG